MNIVLNVLEAGFSWAFPQASMGYRGLKLAWRVTKAVSAFFSGNVVAGGWETCKIFISNFGLAACLESCEGLDFAARKMCQYWCKQLYGE